MARGGVALRNQGKGGINVSGVLGPVQAVYLYWAVITNGAPPPVVGKINISRRFPSPMAIAVTLTGTVVGTGEQLCWAGTTITVYKAKVPLTVATGNGTYNVPLLQGAAGTTNGSNPWNSPTVLPLWEGASLVIFGTGSAHVAIYDSGLAGLGHGLTYSLSNTAASFIRFDEIVADGQLGTSVIAT